MLLVEELLGKVINVLGETSFIGGWVDISLSLILIVDFKDFRFSKMYKIFGV